LDGYRHAYIYRYLHLDLHLHPDANVDLYLYRYLHFHFDPHNHFHGNLYGYGHFYSLRDSFNQQTGLFHKRERGIGSGIHPDLERDGKRCLQLVSDGSIAF
jgi:hypothetical protein